MAYCIAVLLQKSQFNPATVLAGVLLGAVFLWLTGLGLLALCRRPAPGFKTLLAAGIVLFAADQLAKLAVYCFLAPDGFVSLAGDFLQIRFAPNHSNNVLLNLLGIQLGARWLDALLKIVALGVAVPLVVHICKGQKGLLGDLRFRLGATLMAAAAASSLLDTVVYGFVLDFIAFASLVAFDFKDLYLQWGLVLFVLALLRPLPEEPAGAQPLSGEEAQP